MTTLPTPLSLNDPFTLFLFVAAVVLMVGYGVGRWSNQRRGRHISDWLEPGLRSVGGTPTVQRVSRSVFRLQMANARRPFRTVTASAVLISREFFPTWLWERLNGRHDLLIIHITFRDPPSLEADIVDPGNELGRRGEAQAKGFHWPSLDIPPRWRVYFAPGVPISTLQSLASQLAASSFSPWRVALRRNAPHMLISMPMPDLQQARSKDLVAMLVELSRLAHMPFGEPNT